MQAVKPTTSTEPDPAGPPRVVPGSRPLWAKLLGGLLAPWLELTIERQDEVAKAQSQRPICYVLEDYALSNVLILEQACREAGLPTPLHPIAGDPLGRKRAYVALSRRNEGVPTIRRRKSNSHSKSLARLLQAHRLDGDLDVQLIPVSIFVGRAPAKQNGWFSVLFSENWTIVGRFRRILSLSLNGRDTLVRFSRPVSVREVVHEGLELERSVRKLSRTLRGHFRRIRALVIGPDLSTRRLLISEVLGSDQVKQAVVAQARRDSTKLEKASKKAFGFAYEIAADYSDPVVRSVSLMLAPIWNRIYRGVKVNHLDSLKQNAPGFEVVYVPSHRSHMDDLLLPYCLYAHGIVPPHITAGVNLDLPLIGTLMRKGGAFFIRRSIKGNPLYVAVLSEYLARLVSGGYSLAYFIEGGRSRTGRLMPPKGGMLAMTVRAFLRQPTRPVLFQPVYIGYERLMEGRSYLDELSGKPKEKESIWALLAGIPKVLDSNYGQVAVNFGEPIRLDDLLAEHAKEWDGKPLPEDEKPKWLSATIDSLAHRIQVQVNAAADVNPVNLLAMAILATPKHAMDESDLLAQIQLSKTLLTELPYSGEVTVTERTPREIVAHGEEIGMLVRTSHQLGDVLSVDETSAILLSYFRNNVLHLFVAAAWIAVCFHNNRQMARSQIHRLGTKLYPFLQAELFLKWDGEGFTDVVDRTIEVFVREGLLQRTEQEDAVLSRSAGQSDELFRLRVIGHSLQQAFERYNITISVLVKNGSGVLGTAELETMCHLAAQRLSLLYTPAAPEFFDKALFRGFIQKLRETRLVWLNESGKLAFDERLEDWARDAKLVLGRELLMAIEAISPEARDKR